MPAPARRLFERGGVQVSTTVLLESAWVLASAYELDRKRISAALHMAGSTRSEAFVTFDGRLVRHAKRAGTETVVTVQADVASILGRSRQP